MKRGIHALLRTKTARGRCRLILLLAGLLSAVCALAVADGWSMHDGNAQHTALSTAPAQSLEAIHWSTPVDLAPPSGTILIHYGSPLVTPGNTIIVPVKTQTGYQVEARRARDGALIWSQTSDYV